MSKAEETRSFIIEKTAPLFNKKGYAGTSLTDITNATGLTKGSIYGNFENKDEVAIAVFAHNVQTLTKKINAAMNAKESATDKLMALLDYYRSTWKNMFERGGCPILNASIEADDNLPYLKKNVQNSIKIWADNIAKLIETGKQKSEFKKDIVALDYAYTIITLLEGGVMMSKIMNNQNLLFAALDRITIIIDQEMKQ